MTDEGYTEESEVPDVPLPVVSPLTFEECSVSEREEIALRLLGSMTRAELSQMQRRIIPLLQLDIVALLPAELALNVLSNLHVNDLLTASLVSRYWCTLTTDQTLWKSLCHENHWEWKTPSRDQISLKRTATQMPPSNDLLHLDEGVGEEETVPSFGIPGVFEHGTAPIEPHALPSSIVPAMGLRLPINRKQLTRQSAPAVLPSPVLPSLPNYKLLYQTRAILRNRLEHSAFRFTTLPMLPTIPQPPQAPNTVPSGHTSTIYALCLLPNPQTSTPTLFTASRDLTILQWDLSMSTMSFTTPVKVFRGAHTGSVLSICVASSHGWLISGGSDGKVVVWSLQTGLPVKILEGPTAHSDSILCVRCDDKRIVSCSKDRTLRTYSMPSLEPKHVLDSHRAAVNAIALSGDYIVSASGDRSLRLWHADTGELLRVYEAHHSRGLASIDFSMPFVVTGSSDRHIRLFDLSTQRGWTTDQAPLPHPPHPPTPLTAPFPPPLPSPPPETHPSHSLFSRFSTATVVPGSSIGLDNRVAWRLSQLGWPSASRMHQPLTDSAPKGRICEACRGEGMVKIAEQKGHKDLVRAVAMDHDVIVSASYDSTIKVWDRKTGALLADLTGGHTGRIFGVAFDCTKIISCGEDQRICVWDMSWGLDTSFVKL